MEGVALEDRPVQTAMHIFGECDAFVQDRVRYFGDPFPPVPFKIPTKKILAFISGTNLEVLPMLSLEREAEIQERIAEKNRLKKLKRKPKN